MANPGDAFTDQEGGYIVFRETASSSNGDLLEVAVTSPSRSGLPPVHYHPSQEETFEVKGGFVRAYFNGEEHVFQDGDVFVVPPGTRHQMHNSADEPGKVIWQTHPAMKTEVFFETVWGLAQNGE